MRKTIYLGGPMAGCTVEEMTGWRNQLKKEWSEFDFRDPCEREYSPQEWRQLVEDDIQDIDESDYVLCYMWKPGVGSSMELVYARYNNKPIIVVIPDFKYVSPWVRYYSDFLVEDFDQAYKIVKMQWNTAGVEDTHHA